MEKKKALIVTGSSNWMAKRIIETKKGTHQILGLSRSWSWIWSISDQKIDLINKDSTHDIVQNFIGDLAENTELSIFHFAGKVKNEFPAKSNKLYHAIDSDWDWIDDEVLKSGYSTLLNVLDPTINSFNWTVKVWRLIIVQSAPLINMVRFLDLNPIINGATTN